MKTNPDLSTIELINPRQQSGELALEINRLHAEAVRLATESKQALLTAVAAAWQAGQLLLEEKRRVRRTMGAGAWLLWLEQKFHGSPRTAQRYMLLARSENLSQLKGLSLRQVYLQLGIAMEPKTRTQSPRVEKLPSYVRLANRLMAALDARQKMMRGEPEQSYALLRQDLWPLYVQLCRLFEAEAPANFPSSTPFKKAS